MSELDKILKISGTSEDGPYGTPVEATPLPPAPIPSQDPASLVTVQDDYENLESTSILTLDSQIRLPGTQEEKSLRLRDVLTQAGEGNQIAQAALDRIIQERLATQADRADLNQCFIGCEANVVDILIQLSGGDATQQREAARSILSLILGKEVENKADLRGLQKGLLVAAGIIGSEFYYQEVAALDSEDLKDFRDLLKESSGVPETNRLLTAISQNPNLRESENQDEKTPEEVALKNAAGPMGGSLNPEADVLASVTGPLTPLSTSGASPQRVDPSVNTLALVNQTLEKHLARHSAAREILSTSAGKALNIRLAEIASDPQLSLTQKYENTRLAILAKGLGRSDFQGVEQDFLPLQAAATPIAQDIIRGLVGTSVSAGDEGSWLAASASRPGKDLGSYSVAPGEDASIPAKNPSRVSSRGTGSLGGSSKSRLGTTVAGTTINPYEVPASVLSAAGIQGMPRYALALGAGLQSYDSSRESRPSYFIEEISASSGDTHSGSQDNFSGRGQQGQDNQPDSFVS